MNKDEIIHLISHRLASFINQPNRDAVKEALIRELSDILDRATGNQRGEIEQWVGSTGIGTSTYTAPTVAIPSDSGYQLHSLGQTLVQDELSERSVPNHRDGTASSSGLAQMNASSK